MAKRIPSISDDTIRTEMRIFGAITNFTIKHADRVLMGRDGWNPAVAGPDTVVTETNAKDSQAVRAKPPKPLGGHRTSNRSPVP